MTREEAIKELQSYADHSWCGLSEAFELAIAALREQPKWISVEERLPERRKSVIVWTVYGEEGEAEYDGEHFIWAYDEDIAFATHWMPLPEPPKEEV